MDPRQARDAGACFYDLPGEIHEDSVDLLIFPICKRINESGFVATAESCQGHPDATQPQWADNTDPMLRLVYKTEDEGRVFAALMAASRSMEVHPDDESGMTLWGRPGTAPMKIYPEGIRGQPDYCEVLIYVPASTAYYRNRGLEFFRRFAENVNKEG